MEYKTSQDHYLCKNEAKVCKFYPHTGALDFFNSLPDEEKDLLCDVFCYLHLKFQSLKQSKHLQALDTDLQIYQTTYQKYWIKFKKNQSLPLTVIELKAI